MVNYLRIPRLDSLPLATKERDRMIVGIDGGPGVGTKIYICLEQPDGSYDWVELPGAGGGGGGLDAEGVQDVVDAMFPDTDTYTWTYDDTSGTLTIGHTLTENLRRVLVDSHLTSTSNPHSVTKEQVGLGNVDNTSDATKNSAAVTLTNKEITLSSIAGAVRATMGTFTTMADDEYVIVTDTNPYLGKMTWAVFKSQLVTQSGPYIAALTNVTIDTSDSFLITDASDSGNAKRVTWASLLITLLGSFQALDSDLTAIAGLSASNDDVIQRKAGAWTNRTMAQVKTDLALAKGDVGLGNVENVAQSNRGIDLTLGPFYANDLAASSDVEGQYGFFNTATALSRSGNGQRITRAGKVVGVIATTDAARTGGTLTVRPRINGIGNSGITAVIDGTNTTSNSTFSQTGVSFSANDTIDVSFVTSSWGPTTADATAWLVLRLDDF